MQLADGRVQHPQVAIDLLADHLPLDRRVGQALLLQALHCNRLVLIGKVVGLEDGGEGALADHLLQLDYLGDLYREMRGLPSDLVRVRPVSQSCLYGLFRCFWGLFVAFI